MIFTSLYNTTEAFRIIHYEILSRILDTSNVDVASASTMQKIEDVPHEALLDIFVFVKVEAMKM